MDGGEGTTQTVNLGRLTYTITYKKYKNSLDRKSVILYNVVIA